MATCTVRGCEEPAVGADLGAGALRGHARRPQAARAANRRGPRVRPAGGGPGSVRAALLAPPATRLVHRPPLQGATAARATAVLLGVAGALSGATAPVGAHASAARYLLAHGQCHRIGWRHTEEHVLPDGSRKVVNRRGDVGVDRHSDGDPRRARTGSTEGATSKEKPAEMAGLLVAFRWTATRLSCLGVYASQQPTR